MRYIRELIGTANWWQSDKALVAKPASALTEAGQAAVGRKDRWTMRLARAVEAEIIPRLMLSHRERPEQPWSAGPALHGFTEQDVEAFAKLIVEQDFDATREYIEALRSEGRPLRSLFLDLFTPAARHLGELWEQDRRDFMDVTLGLSRLQRLLQEIGPELEGAGKAVASPGRALLVAARGEQHTFGLSMLTEFFRREGWDVWSGRLTSAEDIPGLMQAGPFDLVGFSLSQEGGIDDLAADIRNVRNGADGDRPHIMVGGRVFIDQPGLFLEVGADSTARDAHDALEHVAAVVQRLSDDQRSLRK